MKKTYIAPSIKVKKMETTGELLAGSFETSVHTEGSLPQGVTSESDLANEAWSKKNNCLWDNEEW
jgi:hypothetical protein